ncbi:PEBP-like protein [Tilletiaria anomala UBC 951]|uniref:PEBP-like protein n=1 Tax=Tilletiaria anomala (strain ATCC 24038 / CBS 436.72 / UBC 951) TaxID=1037660 RepID=A0A066WGK8_TILAU|nr:PEBP-like protein [Tilletiaria anomala UBC 951]KDN52911.1 PEBP-like protein [Tilletiaria anomala UBC 951]
MVTNRTASSSAATSQSHDPSTPSSSAGASGASSSAAWMRPIPPGVEPAYDEALAYLSQYQREKRGQVEGLKKEAVSSRGSPEAVNNLQMQIEELEIVAELDDPQVRWDFENGKIDMSRPVHRYLREQAWRRAGPLRKLTERCKLMRVVPDVVPYVTPSADLQVFFGEGAGYGDHGGNGGEVLAGVFLDADVTLEKPRLEATAFHTDERLYTILMVDPDSPDEFEATFQPYAHWLLEDVPLSATRSSIDYNTSVREILPYVPPHPQRGTPYHRYVTLLLTEAPEANSSNSDAAPAPSTPVSEVARHGFSVSEYMARRNLHVAGIHFWREEWKQGRTSAAVKKVYSEILKQPEPTYAKPLKPDPYKDEVAGDASSRYFSSQ